jgi:hypothetical protein
MSRDRAGRDAERAGQVGARVPTVHSVPGNSVHRVLGRGLIPLGALTGGPVAHAFGLRAPSDRGIGLLVALPVLISALRDRPA